MTKAKNSHCSYCGTAFDAPGAYPRRCPGCATLTFENPVPVAVALIPVSDGARTGLLVVRRAINPEVGRLALVGGFVDADERWQVAAAREAREEADVSIDEASLTPLWFTSTEPLANRVLLFATSAPLSAADLRPFAPNSEASERGVVFGPGSLSEIFAFDLHRRAAERFFAGRAISGAADFQPV